MTKNPDDWLDISDFADTTLCVDCPAEPLPPADPAQPRYRWKVAGAASRWDATFRIELRKEDHERDEK